MSYLSHFKFREQPFRLTPDPEFVYLSKQHARAKAYMESTIWLADGFVVITGEIGSGKTTLLQSFLSELDDDVVYAVISQTQLNSTQFLQAILTEFGFKPFNKDKVELIDMLNMFLIEQYSNGKKVVLVVDEAQNLSHKVLEEVRMLSGVETHKDKVLRIILAGQPELKETLESPNLKQLMQRIRLRFHLGPLERHDVQEYVLHRLQVAGNRDPGLIAADCYDTIYRYTGGVPRLINTLCDTALLCAFADGQPTVTAEHFQTAVGELDWQEFTPSNGPFRKFESPARTVTDEQRGQSHRAEGYREGPLAEGHRAEGHRAEGYREGPLAEGHPAQGYREGQLAEVEIRADGQSLSVHSLPKGRVVIGRSPENEIYIRSKFMSRYHAQLVSDENGSLIEDLNSTNGVFVQDQQVKRHRLRHGDVVSLGVHQLVYRDLRDARELATDSDGEASAVR
jgi:putative secretion ATPase (PEP-CTERM system associated)